MASSRSKASQAEDRVFVKDGLRSYRKTYRVSEVKWGLGTGGVLAALLGWVGWKGSHPDPELFDMSAALEEGAGTQAGAPEPPMDIKAAGLWPPGLGEGGYQPRKPGEFSAENLYEKINGRAGYFQSFGVQRMHSLTLLEAGGEPGAERSIDIELYDLGSAQNALGAYNGERGGQHNPQFDGASAFHFDRNSAFLAHGKYYLRLIGSEESAAMTSELERLLRLFRERLTGGELPWAFALFVDQLGFPADRVTYVRKNAFSFGFASDLFKVGLSEADSNEDVEAFVVARDSDAEAQALAQSFREGFASLGVEAGEALPGVKSYKDEFLGSLSTATSVERWVVGVRGAVSAKQLSTLLSRLQKAVEELPPDIKQRAVPTAAEAEDEEEGL